MMQGLGVFFNFHAVICSRLHLMISKTDFKSYDARKFRIVNK